MPVGALAFVMHGLAALRSGRKQIIMEQRADRLAVGLDIHAHHCPGTAQSRVQHGEHNMAKTEHPPLLLLSLAGNKQSLPHLYIAGRTPRPARRFDDDQERRSIMLAVCVRLGQPNMVVQLPTPEEKYDRSKKKKGSVWYNPKPATSSPLTSSSYCRLVLTPLAKAGDKMGTGKRRSPRHPVKLVHDRDSVHTSRETAKFAEAHGIKLVQLPARAADLDPLDYGVFGAVKREWRRRVHMERLDWEAQCSLLIQLLVNADVSAAIKAFPSRIQKCLEAEGGHFEH